MDGRQIHEAIGVAQETIHSVKQMNMKGAVIKIDLSKAYDRISGTYLRMLLTHLGFKTDFNSWIMGCITSVNFAVLINGAASPFFKGKRGLRQGCPLSPLLFLLVAEGLSQLILKAKGPHGAGVIPSFPTREEFEGTHQADAARKQSAAGDATLLDAAKPSHTPAAGTNRDSDGGAETAAATIALNTSRSRAAASYRDSNGGAETPSNISRGNSSISNAVAAATAPAAAANPSRSPAAAANRDIDGGAETAAATTAPSTTIVSDKESQINVQAYYCPAIDQEGAKEARENTTTSQIALIKFHEQTRFPE